MGFKRTIAALASAVVLLAPVAHGQAPIDATSSTSGADWPWYHGNPYGTHYSTLAQITPANVHALKVAWTFDSGDAFGGGNDQSDMEGNPLIVHGRLYFVSPKGRLFCLDAATGEESWVFDPADGVAVTSRQRLRGVNYWSDGRADERILFTFADRLIAVDARTGARIDGFGRNGAVDLREGLGRDPQTVSVANVTPGAVYKDLIIMGSTGNTPGHIRAYDVRTGALRWIFHTIPHPGEPGYATWPRDAWKTAMGDNAWSGLTLDPERGLVFVPVASAGMGAKDIYGGDRKGDDRFGTSLVALDASTGKRVWDFQLVRHDLWDRDPPTPPTLITVRRQGRDIPAVAQTTKAGVVFILDRLTGKSLYPLQTLHPPASDIPGETASPTQVLPRLPEPYARQKLTRDLLTRRTPEAHAFVAKTFATLRSRGPFDPPSLGGTVLLPGMDGGAEWGGAAYDPDTGLLYINANEMAWILKVKAQPPKITGASGEALYQNSCAACHGADRKGSPPEFPPLSGITTHLTAAQIDAQITHGGGRMPGFPQLTPQEKAAIIGYLGGDPLQMAQKSAPAIPSTDGDPYVFDGYNRFLDPDGYPAIAPPWGTLSALDVNTGRYVWKEPLGYYPELPDHSTGSENYGGAVVTRGGVLFIAATIFDNQFRAFDKATGTLLWQTTLPVAGAATPATYSIGGTQYVVIGAGGGKNAKGSPGGSILAFSLPK